ncbi:TatD family hydrolase [Marinobacterium jannaschii]|uniref:TatD family hydrolase n=1 Tax=Marinobacterium jannaschii TaxID=64970 RepID=UPI000485B271|nr:TatD family hydrolase [Marinobacterium jannaschii]
MYIDSHCHLDKLDLTPYDGDLSALLSQAEQCQVSKMLCVSVEMEQFQRMYSLIEPYSQVFASVGVHPLSADKGVVSVEELIAETTRERIVAIGETGLDYYYQQDTIELQQQSFRNHLIASSQSGLPTIVHTRDARQDTLDIIRQSGDPEVGGVLHCFTESWEMARDALDLNYMISISGIVTFRNAEELRNVVKQVPLDRLLIETDAPYLAPVPYRGKKNEPRYVVEVAQCVADIKGVRLEELAEITSENFFRLFSAAA